MDRDAARQHAWDQLRDIAYPDSRYHLDFAEFIPGYPGCEDAPGALSGLPFWPVRGPVFVTPDGSTEPLRAFLLREGRPLLTATHGGRRGFRFFPARLRPHPRHGVRGDPGRRRAVRQADHRPRACGTWARSISW